ncbi:MAG: hypothetical protein K5663_04095 [Clostridiales bacterium]|nr:hypothetical protein [Clostridiales bacterium]
MKILLTGVLPRSVWTIAERIARGDHEITVLGQIASPQRRIRGVHHAKLNLAAKETVRFIQASGFDSILFFFAFQCEDQREYDAVQGRQLDVMFEILGEAGGLPAEQFVLITDQRVFGEGQQAAEDETPIPDTTTGVMIRAAESCISCCEREGLKTLIVRTTSLYDIGDQESFFGIAGIRARDGRDYVLHGSPEMKCDFLHADDFAVFLEYAVSMQLSGVVHVAQGVPSTYAEVAEVMRETLPDLNMTFIPGRRCQNVLNGKRAALTGWVPRHDYRREMAEICRVELPDVRKKRRNRTARPIRQTVLKWAEMILIGLLAVGLTRQSQGVAILSRVDFMLLYTVLMGFVHGRAAGLTAAVLSCVYYGYAFVQTGGAASDLLFNTDHWLPMSIYLLMGGLFGYVQDRQRVKIALLEEEREEIRRERDFMEGIYQRTYEDRNRLKEQIYNYHDSYGRIYQITREFDTLQPVQVFLSTLHVLESTLQNNSAAIYECKPGSSFARLVVRSREIKQAARSMDLKAYPEMYDTLLTGKLFANHAMQSEYPVYALPVMDGEDMLAVLMLWDVSFDQQSMYMENLLSVVAGLVQSALARAIHYHRQIADMYYEDTRILMPEAFRAALQVYHDIRQERTGEYLLTRLQLEQEIDIHLLDRYMDKLVRSTDMVGRMENGDYYVLFPQATVQQLPLIQGRFNDYHILCEVVSEETNLA